jgi:hypothetical protein
MCLTILERTNFYMLLGEMDISECDTPATRVARVRQGGQAYIQVDKLVIHIYWHNT